MVRPPLDLLGHFLGVEISTECTALWRGVPSQYPKSQKQTVSDRLFGRREVEKLHAILAQSAFAHQKLTVATDGLGRFWT